MLILKSSSDLDRYLNHCPVVILILTLILNVILIMIQIIHDFDSNPDPSWSDPDTVPPPHVAEILEIPQVDLKIQRSSILVHRQDSYLKVSEQC